MMRETVVGVLRTKSSALSNVVLLSLQHKLRRTEKHGSSVHPTPTPLDAGHSTTVEFARKPLVGIVHRQ